MTGKSLKQFANSLPDEAVVEVRERSYGEYDSRFQIRAIMVYVEAAPVETEEVLWSDVISQ